MNAAIKKKYFKFQILLIAPCWFTNWALSLKNEALMHRVLHLQIQISPRCERDNAERRERMNFSWSTALARHLGALGATCKQSYRDTIFAILLTKWYVRDIAPSRDGEVIHSRGGLRIGVERISNLEREQLRYHVGIKMRAGRVAAFPQIPFLVHVETVQSRA